MAAGLASVAVVVAEHAHEHEVHAQAEQRDDEHRAAVDHLREEEPLDRLDDEQHRHHPYDAQAGERAEHLVRSSGQGQGRG